MASHYKGTRRFIVVNWFAAKGAMSPVQKWSLLEVQSIFQETGYECSDTFTVLSPLFNSLKHTEDTEEQTELIEENKDNQELSEYEEKNNAKSRENPLSCSQTKQKDLKKRAKKSFTCTQCGKSLTSKYKFDVHIRVHTGDKPFTCDQCGKSFTQSSSLKKHMHIHTGEKPYKCSYCDERFSQSGYLKPHERIHTGEKLYTCDQCGKSFT
ncbi:oocyte zinc finger protein XlCOF6-like, partial [Sinocyclocheilus rhinocerous]|uniref:oocyte zinc finger protein XlCOF6-like n=1 Tax=Sinocyclocheilus rhinocerous TaxID=307959 RepID=UPI0007B927EE